MSDPLENPYAPPASLEPNVVQMEVTDGRSWRVEDGKLLATHYASLPDVCIHGSPPGEPGERRSMAFHWNRPWLAILLVTVTAILGAKEGAVSLVLCMLATKLVLHLTGKTPRIMVFQSNAARTRRLWINVVGTVVEVVFVIFIIEHLRRSAPSGEILLTVVAAWIYLSKMFVLSSTAKPIGDGWFKLEGISPKAIERLAAIQGKTTIPHDSARRVKFR